MYTWCVHHGMYTMYNAHITNACTYLCCVLECVARCWLAKMFALLICNSLIFLVNQSIIIKWNKHIIPNSEWVNQCDKWIKQINQINEINQIYEIIQINQPNMCKCPSCIDALVHVACAHVLPHHVHTCAITNVCPHMYACCMCICTFASHSCAIKYVKTQK